MGAFRGRRELRPVVHLHFYAGRVRDIFTVQPQFNEAKHKRKPGGPGGGQFAPGGGSEEGISPEISAHAPLPVSRGASPGGEEAVTIHNQLMENKQAVQLRPKSLTEQYLDKMQEHMDAGDDEVMASDKALAWTQAESQKAVATAPKDLTQLLDDIDEAKKSGDPGKIADAHAAYEASQEELLKKWAAEAEASAKAFKEHTEGMVSSPLSGHRGSTDLFDDKHRKAISDRNRNLAEHAPEFHHDAEEASVKGYTGSDSEMINEHLRSKSYSDDPDEIEQIEYQASLIGDWLNKASLPHDMTLYRGVHGSIAKKILGATPGKIFRDKGFMSTSHDIFTATNFAGSQDKSGVLMRIDAKKGHKASLVEHVSENQGEHEVLIQRSSRLRVKNVDPVGRVVHMELLQDEPKAQKPKWSGVHEEYA